MAANNYTNTSYEIRDIALFSKNETIYPNWAGYTSVRFTESIMWALPDVCDSSSRPFCGTSALLWHHYLCHKYSGKKLREIGELFKVGETAVAEARRLLSRKMEKDRKLGEEVEKVEAILSI